MPTCESASALRMTRRSGSINPGPSPARRWHDSETSMRMALKRTRHFCPPGRARQGGTALASSRYPRRPARLFAASCLLLGPLGPGDLLAEGAPQAAQPSSLEEHVQVTATRIPERTGTTPASVTVITRDDLIRRGAYDLRSALALAAGVDVAPGGDGGPAGFVPEF